MFPLCLLCQVIGHRFNENRLIKGNSKIACLGKDASKGKLTSNTQHNGLQDIKTKLIGLKHIK